MESATFSCAYFTSLKEGFRLLCRDAISASLPHIKHRCLELISLGNEGYRFFVRLAKARSTALIFIALI